MGTHVCMCACVYVCVCLCLFLCLCLGLGGLELIYFLVFGFASRAGA